MTDRPSSFSKEDLIYCGTGQMFGDGNATLPNGNMLMIDRIASITADGGEFGKGYIEAELDINPELWFFPCHFTNDPVMPGCLGLDAMWQLVGFYLGWAGLLGRGRALGCGQVKFSGQVMPEAKLVTYKIDMRRIVNRRLKMGVANAVMECDGKVIYSASDLKVGLFSDDEA